MKPIVFVFTLIFFIAFFSALFDWEPFMKLTRSHRRNYEPFGKTFWRIFYGVIGLFGTLIGLSILPA